MDAAGGLAGTDLAARWRGTARRCRPWWQRRRRWCRGARGPGPRRGPRSARSGGSTPRWASTLRTPRRQMARASIDTVPPPPISVPTVTRPAAQAAAVAVRGSPRLPITTVSGASKARAAATFFRLQHWIVGRLDDGARHDVERRAAGVKVEEGVAARIDLVGHEGRDLLRDGAARIAGKRPVEVQAVDGRGPLSGHDGVDVVGRHQDEAALDLAGVELADQLADRDRPFILVAVIAALDDDGRPFAVG